MKSLADEEILHQIKYENYKNGEVEKIIKFIADTNKKITKELKKTKGVATKQRYNELSKILKTLSAKLKSFVEKNIDVKEIIKEEIDTQLELLGKYIPINTKTKISLKTPSYTQIENAVLFEPYTQNSNFGNMLNNLQNNFYNTWDNAIRQGYMLGEPTKKIIDNVIGEVSKDTIKNNSGTMQSIYNSIASNTRTVLQMFARESRESVFLENEDLFGDNEGNKYKYLATLDRRSCVVCGNYDGKVFKSLTDAPKTPIHLNCRCLVIPIVKGFEDFESTRASEKGTVEGKTDYATWISQQNEKTQKEILGSTRFDLLKKGVPISAFVDNGKKLTLVEINEKLNNPEFEEVNAKKFANAIAKSKSKMAEEMRWRVSAYGEDHYTTSKNFVTKNGSTVSVMPDGDIVSVCASGDRGKVLMAKAVEEGGIKLDSFDFNFTFYTKQGFEPVSWCKFNEEFAPDDWVKGRDKPENIVFFKYTGKKQTLFAKDFYENVKESVDYDTALKIREDSL